LVIIRSFLSSIRSVGVLTAFQTFPVRGDNTVEISHETKANENMQGMPKAVRMAQEVEILLGTGSIL
jgi:hypothetical protein